MTTNARDDLLARLASEGQNIEHPDHLCLDIQAILSEHAALTSANARLVEERDGLLNRLHAIIGAANGDGGPPQDEWALEDPLEAVEALAKERDDACAKVTTWESWYRRLLKDAELPWDTMRDSAGRTLNNIFDGMLKATAEGMKDLRTQLAAVTAERDGLRLQLSGADSLVADEALDNEALRARVAALEEGLRELVDTGAASQRHSSEPRGMPGTAMEATWLAKSDMLGRHITTAFARASALLAAENEEGKAGDESDARLAAAEAEMATLSDEERADLARRGRAAAERALASVPPPPPALALLSEERIEELRRAGERWPDGSTVSSDDFLRVFVERMVWGELRSLLSEVLAARAGAKK